MVKIIADTTSCISVEDAKKWGIPYIPQIIVFGNDSYRDDTEMDSDAFLKRLRASSSLPKTAAPPPPLYYPVFEELKTNGETGIVICPSNEVSGTIRSALTAAAEFPDVDIRVIDSYTIGTGLGSIVLNAKQWADAGLSGDEIAARIEEMRTRQKTYFVVDTLEYLYKGGRIGAARALMGSVLQVKPILFFYKQASAAESQRTRKKALARLGELVLSDCAKDGTVNLAMMHADALESANKLSDYFKSQLGLTDIPIRKVPPALIVHAGPGVVAVSYFTK